MAFYINLVPFYNYCVSSSYLFALLYFKLRSNINKYNYLVTNLSVDV